MFSDPDSVITQSYVAEGMTVADFGAGVGFYTLALAKKVGEYGRVFAIDVLSDHLRKLVNEAARQGLHNIEVIQSDLETEKGSGLLAASVDRIIIANTLFQTDHPRTLVIEAKRVLKHDGKVAVIDWAESFNQIGPHTDHVVTKEESRKYFEEEGFNLESFIDAGSHHYGLLYTLKSKPSPGSKENMKKSKRGEDENPGLIVPPVDIAGFNEKETAEQFVEHAASDYAESTAGSTESKPTA